MVALADLAHVPVVLVVVVAWDRWTCSAADRGLLYAVHPIHHQRSSFVFFEGFVMQCSRKYYGERA